MFARLLLVALLSLIPSWADAAPAENPEALARQLEELQAEIDKFRRMLESTRGERATLEDTLEANEKEIGEILKKIDQLQKNLETGEGKVSRLRAEQWELELAREEQQQLIKRQIRAAYEIGSQEYLKVVLNQEDPNQVDRMLRYYDYFNRARAEQIETYKETLAELDRVTRSLLEQNRRIEADRETLAGQMESLTAAQAEKRITLAALNEEIERTGTAIENRVRDRERLEALLERITAGIVNLPTPRDTVPFEDLRGKLVLPVAGSVTNQFGTLRTAGKMTWNGVFIEAPVGEPVSAVHYGRVVFSDWLRGFGLLLIINHGHGYMSLYGHNQVLYRETGDWVTAGETIASVGDSGGQNRAGLYFEIRQAGRPTDPQQWCKARPGAARPGAARPIAARPDRTA